MEIWQLIVIGVGVHVVVFFSMFDLYFTTPLVHGMTRYKARGPAPAKRLVLYVGDGMRADTVFGLNESGKPNAPFLRKVIEERGAWGVSHGRGPTESRPSHVALVAGFFEDVSAVKKKWTENPVPYDSVFNQSRHTWAWGCHKVVQLFSKAVKEVPITASSYPSNIGDRDYAKMDPWVFTHVKEFFAGAAKDEKKRKMVEGDRLVFFLHLQSPDSSGHENLPHSRKYAQTIGILDEGVRNTTDMIEKFFKDGSTAYILTGDHGMSDGGKHGDNSPQELETPVVAWGAGLRGPEVVERCGDYVDGYCPNSKLEHRSRQDVQQIDLASLMAYLIGLNYPANSMGELPVGFLGGNDEQKAEAMYANARQMIVQFLVKMANVKNRTLSATFRPFRFEGLPKFYQKPDISAREDSWPEQSDTSDPMILLRNIRNLIDKGRYKDAITESQLVVRATVRGLRYYHTYDRAFLGLSVTLGFLGWLGCVFLSMVSVYTPASYHPPEQSPARARRHFCVVCSLFGTAGIVTTTLLYVQCVPRTYYCYALLPVFLWMKLALRWIDVQHVARKAVEQGMLCPVLCLMALVAVVVLFVVLCFAYREMMSVGLILMALWVVTTPAFVSQKKTCMGWMLSCAVLAVFPLLQPVWKSTCIELVILSGVVASSVGFFLTFRISRSQPSVSASPPSRGVHFVQVVLVAIATLVVSLIRYHVDLFTFLTKNRQWLLGASFLCPLLTDVSIHVRLFSLCLALLVPFLLMSITYETFFCLSLMCLLYFWLRIEGHLSQQDDDQADLPTSFGAVLPFLSQKGDRHGDRFLHFDDVRLTFFYLFFVIISFFGWTDIFSVNNALPITLKCLEGLFSSSISDYLKYVKLAFPFLMVTCVMNAVRLVNRIPFRALCMLITLMADSLGLTFLFLVRDFGTWRQVGTSITHYVIGLLVGPAVMLTLMLCQVFAAFSLPSLVLCVRARWLRVKRWSRRCSPKPLGP